MRQLSEMNDEELKVIFKKSNSLQMEVLSRVVDNFYDLWTEILDMFDRNTVDYVIDGENSLDNRISIELEEAKDFIEKMDKIQNAYCLFDDEHQAEYNAFKNFYKEFEDMVEDSPEYEFSYENLSNMLDDISGYFSSLIQEDCESVNSTEHLINTFLEWYVEEMTNEWSNWNYTVDEEYKLYRTPKYAELML